MFVKKFCITIFLAAQFLLAEGGMIVGTVKDKITELPIPEVQIKIMDTDFETTTDDSGKFVIEDIEPGTYNLKTVCDKYDSVLIKNIVVERGSETVVNIWLQRRYSDKYFMSTKKTEQTHTRKEGYYSFSSSKKSDSRKSSESESIESKNKSEVPLPPIIEYEPYEVSAPKKMMVPGQSGLKAGYADDNQQFNYFLNFLEKYKDRVDFYPIKIQERIQLRIIDQNDQSIPNADIRLYAGNNMIDAGITYADGSYFIYPLESNLRGHSIRAFISYQRQKKEVVIDRDGPRQIEIKLNVNRQQYNNIPLDLLFILDTTGSMGEEIERLKSTIEIINLNLSSLKIKPAIRYGMILYRDREDDYITKLIPFTGDLEAFQKDLNTIRADGGGDHPEDLQSALKDAMQKMSWNNDGIRLAFVITDASAHLDYEQDYTYAQAAKDAKEAAIKIFSVGSGGLDIEGEYILRQISQYTYAKYIFLTYGEEGESEGGRPGSVSHHTGTNYQTDKLEAIIIRFAKEELANVSDLSLEEDESYFQAVKIEDEEKEETLKKLFYQAVNELQDYSTIAILEGTTVSAMPIAVKRQSLANNAEYFTEQLIYALGVSKPFKLIERKDLQFIAREVGLQLSGLIELDDAVRVGEFIGADMLIIGNLYFKDKNYEIFLKLVRVETAEILAVTKLKIDYHLGL